jgi:hypothetical protein
VGGQVCSNRIEREDGEKGQKKGEEGKAHPNEVDKALVLLVTNEALSWCLSAVLLDR